MDKHLHIISFDVPFPANYGGVFEIYHTLRSLHREGVKIHLHCFDYGRGQQPELKKYCESVHYYERHTGHKGFSMKLPYIVSSRANPELQENLSRDDHPILLEGIHTSYYLQDDGWKNRKVALRLHNIEHEYYRQQGKQSNSLFRKLYFWNESRLLKAYEKKIANRCLVLAMVEKDANYYRTQLGSKQSAYLPPFIGWDYPHCEEGVGHFVLYHGNLAVEENQRAATWLLQEVFNNVEIPFVIAGKDPSPALEALAHQQQHTCMVSNPSDLEMEDLIKKAQIHILPSFTDTGVKFKLLHAVFCGRHIVANEEMLEGTKLDSACHVAKNADAFKSILMQLYRKPFTDDEIMLRDQLLQDYYNNTDTARRLISWLW
ncbi:MAG: glycosyltransferase [Sphingobacteriales bacterium]|nr:MAG: glycosyltransferase [Sphingobacteriales bacterium]